MNADVSASAAIAYSKLNLTTSIVNADISASAAIAYSKLNLTTSIVNGDISASAAIVYSKLNLTGGILNTDISATAAIARNKIATGPINQVVINDGATGLLTSEANLAVSRGGTGVGTLPTGQAVIGAGTSAVTSMAVTSANTVSTIVQRDNTGAISVGPLTATTITASLTVQLSVLSTGLVHSGATGILSSSTLVNADVSATAAIDYSKLNLTGNIVNADISATAAIARSKIAAGTVAQVVINDPSTGLLSSEANLAVSRGGTGVGTLPTGQVVVGAGTSAVTSLAVASANTASAIVQRDGAGAVAVGALTTTTITASGVAQLLAGVESGMLQYSTGTITQAGTAITGSGTTFLSTMAGGVLFPYGGDPEVISTFNSLTSLTMYTSQTIAAGTSYTIFYTLGNGFGLTPNGTLYLRTPCTSANPSVTGLLLQLEAPSANSSYNVDVQTYAATTTAANGRWQFTDNVYGCNLTWYSVVSGAPGPLTQLFQVNANKTVTTFNNTLDSTTTGNANFLGTVTTPAVILPTLSTNATNGTLDTYQEYSHTTNWGGPFTAASFTCKLTRNGRIVHVTFPPMTGTGNNTSTLLSAVVNFPAQFLPAADIQWNSVLTVDNGISSLGWFSVGPSSVRFGQALVSTFTNNTGLTGVNFGTSFSWTV